MKMIGIIVTAFGFLVASWVAAQERTEVNWLYFGIALAVSVAGVVLMRLGATKQATDAEALSGNITTIRASLEKVVKNITELDAKKETLSPYDFHGIIDQTFPEDLAVVVEGRKAIGHLHGLKAYADFMNSFAAGERYLNRVWSCSVDGYVDEAHEYLSRSKEQFIETEQKLSALGATA